MYNNITKYIYRNTYKCTDICILFTKLVMCVCKSKNKRCILSKVRTGYLKIKQFNPLSTKRRQLYLNTQFVPRSKHFSSRL